MNKEPRTMQVSDAATASRAPENTPAMVKKIGKTTYKVHVHFSNTSTETMSDKIKRMLNQASGDRQILAKQLNISPFQLSYVTNSNEGEGLLFYGNTIIPFKDKFDTSLKLYSLMTTKPNEMGKYKEKKEA